VLAITGCRTSGLDAGRAAFRRGDYTNATAQLIAPQDDIRNHVLYLMERGMAYHVLGDYEESNRDWQKATETIRELDYLSVSRSAASVVVNDYALAFRGAPYERGLLHAFGALNYFALAKWDGAAVEARLLVDCLSNLDGYPDVAFARYVAATAFEAANQTESAEIEYERAGELVKSYLEIDPRTGFLQLPDTSAQAKSDYELICFVSVGTLSNWGPSTTVSSNAFVSPYVEVVQNGRSLGRSYHLDSVNLLQARTEARRAAARAAKTVGRIVLKETIAYQVSEHNALLGELLRLAFYLMEVPDTRHWETLPAQLLVARVPCDAPLSEYTLVLHGQNGMVRGRRIIQAPITRRHNTFYSFARFP